MCGVLLLGVRVNGARFRALGSGFEFKSSVSGFMFPGSRYPFPGLRCEGPVKLPLLRFENLPAQGFGFKFRFSEVDRHSRVEGVPDARGRAALAPPLLALSSPPFPSPMKKQNHEFINSF